MIDTILSETARELTEILKAKKTNWKRLRCLQQVLKTAQTMVQIEGQVLNNRQKHGEIILLQHELKTLLNFIRSEGGSVHRFKLKGRKRAHQIIRHGLETGVIKLIPAETGSNDLDIIQIEQKVKMISPEDEGRE
jgi:hypothetical protein